MKTRLKEARFMANMTQIELQNRSGVHASTISRIEAGHLNPSDHQMQRLSKGLGKSVLWLFPESAGTTESFKKENL